LKTLEVSQPKEDELKQKENQLLGGTPTLGTGESQTHALCKLAKLK